ncbi:MAG: hypothetical protein ACO4AU_15590, partial [bacterium]
MSPHLDVTHLSRTRGKIHSSIVHDPHVGQHERPPRRADAPDYAFWLVLGQQRRRNEGHGDLP